MLTCCQRNSAEVSAVHVLQFHFLPSWLAVPDCCADEGYYAGGTFTFLFRVPESYPSDPPRVKCLTQASLGGSLNTRWAC